MGTNTLPTARAGTFIPTSHHNSLVQALSGTLVPRNSSRVATDLAGSLGSSSYQWSKAYINELFFGETGNSLKLEDDSGSLKISVGGTELVTLGSSWRDVVSGSSNTMPKNGVALMFANNSTASSSFATLGTSPTITTLGRPVIFNGISGNVQVSGTAVAEVRLKRGSTVISTIEIDMGAVTFPPGALGFVDYEKPSGAHQYTIEGRVTGGSGTLFFTSVNILAWELF